MNPLARRRTPVPPLPPASPDGLCGYLIVNDARTGVTDVTLFTDREDAEWQLAQWHGRGLRQYAIAEVRVPP